MEVRPSGREREVKPEQPLKALLPIWVTLPGIVSGPVKPEQPLKAPLLIMTTGLPSIVSGRISSPWASPLQPVM